ncbi:MAG: hypothetical protein SH850_10880 [Planctomycetaceae bacterium]|nr:hypothetical protein [Planctomycetaceae bacterium]
MPSENSHPSESAPRWSISEWFGLLFYVLLVLEPAWAFGLYLGVGALVGARMLYHFHAALSRHRH